MTQLKHTPGPWRNNRGCIVAERDGALVPIAEIRYIVRARAEERANASLIAASPELIEALKELLSWANIHDDGTRRATNYALCVSRKARAAIAKATGEQ